MVRITPQDAEKMMAAYQKVYAPQDESKPESENNSEAPQVSDEIAAQLLLNCLLKMRIQNK